MKKHCCFNLLLVVAIVLTSCASKMQETNSDAIKVAIRAVGHELLLAQNDSTSLVLPIEKVDARTYKLQFQKELSIEPGFLTETITRNFKTAELSSNYIIEVVQCSDDQIAYSYQMKRKKDNEIVPCGGRVLPKSCYLLLVKFQKNNKTGLSLWISVALLLVSILIVLFILKRRTVLKRKEEDNDDRIKLGGFIFYPEQHKLVKQALEISLSKKECEILEIFSEKPNEIISREELTKRIWEDNGVVVGRSLDTYISKLRKKLQDDPNIKLTNVHGIGYKLEVS